MGNCIINLIGWIVDMMFLMFLINNIKKTCTMNTGLLKRRETTPAKINYENYEKFNLKYHSYYAFYVYDVR